MLIYVAIMAAKLSRISRDIAELAELAAPPRREREARARGGAAMSELLALGTSHKTAPLALREKLALLDGGAETLIRELTGHPSIAEAVAISTCNRTELYLVVSDPVEAESHVLGLLARRAGDPADRAASAACTRCATATPRATCTGSRAASSR